ncbi:hypothetical protein IIM_04796 [Bacillus cereus VD107]|nr:hypothetical protein IIM_04796 [Bacillus cereus VD107]
MNIPNIDLGFIYNSKNRHDIKKMLPFFSVWSKQNLVSIALYNLTDVNIGELRAKGIIIKNGKVTKGYMKIPYFNYNFASHSRKNNKKKMRELRRNKQIVVINPFNHFNQSILFEMISSFYPNNPFLFPYQSLNKKNLMDYMKTNKILLLLEEKSFIPSKIIQIQNANTEDFEVYYGQNKQTIKKDNLISYLQKMIQDKPYIVLHGKKLLMWDGLPLETRVYVQKQANGQWEIGEILVKRSLLSNGRIYKETLEEILEKCTPQDHIKIIDKLKQIPLQIFPSLDFHIPFLGSCYLDFVFDHTGNPFILYIGGWDTNHYLFKLDDNTPAIHYVKNAFSSLLDKKKQVEEKRDDSSCG